MSEEKELASDSSDNGATEQTSEEDITVVQPSDEQPSDEQPSDEQPSDEQPSDEQPSDEQPSDEQPSDEQSSDEQTADELHEAPDLEYDGILSVEVQESGNVQTDVSEESKVENELRRSEAMNALGESAVSILTEAFRPDTATPADTGTEIDAPAEKPDQDAEKTPLSEITDEYFGGITEKVMGDLENDKPEPPAEVKPKPENPPEAALRPPKRPSKNSDKVILIPLAVFCTFIVVVLLVNLIDSVTQIGSKTIYSVQTVERGVNNAVFDAYRHPITITLTQPDEKVVSMSVQPYTVGELIDDLYGSSGGDYIANVPSDTVLCDGMALTVWEIKNGTYEIVESVAYETEIVEVQTIPKGTDVVIQSGADGVARRTYADTYLNGELSESVIVSETMIVAPVSEIVYRGVGGTFKTNSGRTYSFSYYIDVEATAYGVDTGYGGDGKHTATGALAQSGVVAVDPEVIPLGSTLFVTGEYKEIGLCRAEDTGGAILGSRIDIYMGNDLEAQVAFGRRDMRVYVLD